MSENNGHTPWRELHEASVAAERYGAIETFREYATPSAIKRLVNAYDADQAKIKALVDALTDAKSHLEFCGYGDSYERECAKAGKLEQRIAAAIELAEGK